MNKKAVIFGIALFAVIVSIAASTAFMAKAVATSGACDPADNKHTTICHVKNFETMCVANAAVSSHQKQGDTIGPCQPG